MTSKGLYEGVLIELNKENAPNVLLEDFNYYANKAINQFINKRYNIYDVNQQTTDDLRVLKASALLIPKKVDSYNSMSLANMATYEVILPSDYLHILNCICVYNVRKTYKCYNKGDTWRSAAKRLTADAYSQVLDNFWSKPTYKRPYYYIHNVNVNSSNPTNPYNSDTGAGTDVSGISVASLGDSDGNGNSIGKPSGGLPKTISIGGNEISNVERAAEVRYGNVSQVRMEIRYGTDDSVFSLEHNNGDEGGYVYIDYIKAPQHIRLTQEQLDYTEDRSQMLEFPDYVCQEIINELVHLIMEQIGDQRIQTHPVVSQSIATQQQAPEQAGQPTQ